MCYKGESVKKKESTILEKCTQKAKHNDMIHVKIIVGHTKFGAYNNVQCRYDTV